MSPPGPHQQTPRQDHVAGYILVPLLAMALRTGYKQGSRSPRSQGGSSKPELVQILSVFNPTEEKAETGLVLEK